MTVALTPDRMRCCTSHWENCGQFPCCQVWGPSLPEGTKLRPGRHSVDIWSQNDTVKWQQTWTKMVGGQCPDSIQWCVWVNLIWLSLLMLVLCHFWCSLTVWGYNYEGVQSGRHWSHAEKNFHIKYLGIKAAFFALKCLLSKLQKKHEAAVSCLSHMGTNNWSVSCNNAGSADLVSITQHLDQCSTHTGQRQCSCRPRV